MSTTTRDFTRRFPAHRKAALAGETVEVRDRAGNAFTFTLKKPSPKTLAEALGHLAGVVDSGQTIKKLEGYGRR